MPAEAVRAKNRPFPPILRLLYKIIPALTRGTGDFLKKICGAQGRGCRSVGALPQTPGTLLCWGAAPNPGLRRYVGALPQTLHERKLLCAPHSASFVLDSCRRQESDVWLSLYGAPRPTPPAGGTPPAPPQKSQSLTTSAFSISEVILCTPSSGVAERRGRTCDLHRTICRSVKL